MTTLGVLLEQAQREHQEAVSHSHARRPYLAESFTFEEFLALFKIEAQTAMAGINQVGEYTIDRNNAVIIEALFLYLKGKGTLLPHKGILIAGSIGIGKTITLLAFCRVIERVLLKIIKHISALELSSQIGKNGLDEYLRRPLFIDDLGKEPLTQKIYGTTIQALSFLLDERYSYGSWTFATTNYNLKTLSEFYSEHTADRMREMFNIVEMTGNTRRK